MIRPYTGGRSILRKRFQTPVQGELALEHWRMMPHNPRRLAAIKELAAHLKDAGIKSVGGPVLSGALFAQAIADAVAGIAAVYLPKPGYVAERHVNGRQLVEPWVFVDDVVASGRSIQRAASLTAIIPAPPEAIVALTVMGHYSPAKEWPDVPLLILNGRG